MFCNKCSMPIPENARFCPKCGNPVSGESAAASPTPAPMAESLAASLEVTPVSTKMKTSTKLIIAALLIVACAAGVYNYLTKPLSPEQVAAQFLDALIQGNYSQAYSYFDETEFMGQTLLDEESFQDAMSDFDFSEYQIQQISNEDEMTIYIPYIALVNGERSEDQLALINAKIKEKDKDNWKIVPGNFITSTYISAPAGVTLKINEQEVPITENGTEIAMFNNYSFQAVFANPSIQTQTVEGKAGDSIGIEEMLPSDKIQQELKDIVIQYNNDWITAMNSRDISSLKKTIKEDSDEWSQQKDSIEELIREELTHQSKLKQINFGKIYFGDNLDSVYVEADEIWDVTITDANGEITMEKTDEVNKWTYRLEKQGNGQWLIISNYTRY